ncbi:MAG: AgmX/PglI C-terminal domain-containing protein [Deltaproteobacteria bacterium]|nr:AgmX/PglI C-terminal domain-containing protein [Deltaproteobacteria bacterium]
MHSSALRSDDCPELATPAVLDGRPALEVRALYRDVVIGTRFLADATPKRRLRAVTSPDPGTSYTIGESPGSDAPASSELLGCATLPLVTKWRGGFLVNVTPRMDGDVATGGKVYRLADYVAGRGSSFTLPADARARIECGAMSFRLLHTTRARPLPKRWFAWRWDEQKHTVGSILALGLFLLMIFAVPPEGMSISRDLLGGSRGIIPITVKPPVQEEIPDFFEPRPDQSHGAAGKAHAGKPGKMGNPNSKNPEGAYAIKKNGEPPHLGKAEAEALAREAGIVGVLNRTAGARFASIFGHGTAAGDAENDIMGNLIAADFGDAYGPGGFGVTGTGPGGGGTGLPTIGFGNYNTLGGRGYGHGPGIGGLRAKKHAKIRDVIPGVATTRGALDKEIIRRIVRAHMNEVKYCYDRELVRNKDLAGRISLQFVISGTGQVISSFVQSTTMNNVRVESCVAGAVKRWSFPKPTGGGIAIVSYPLNFVAGAGN